jgi:hypothetical protein
MTKKRKKLPHPLDEISRLVRQRNELQSELSRWLAESPEGGTAPFLSAQIHELNTRLRDFTPPAKA